MGRTPIGQPTRRQTSPIAVWVLPEERQCIAQYASEAGLSLSAYLRVVGLGERPPSVIDLHQVTALAKVNADLGRLGGLLKLWLTNRNDARNRAIDFDQVVTTLKSIGTTQEELLGIVRTIIKRF